MKLNKLFVALMAVALPLGFTACGSDDNESSEPYVFPEAPNKAKAATYTFSSWDTPIQSVSFSEGSSAIIEVEGLDGVEYIVGTYTESNGVYTVTAPDGQTYQFKVTVNGSDYKVVITVAGESVTVEAKKTAPSASGADDLLADWKPFKTQLNLTHVIVKGEQVENPGSFMKEFVGANFQEMKEFAENKGCVIIEDLEGFDLQKVAFFGTFKFSASFKNKESYTAIWETTSNWKDDGVDLKFTWEDENSQANEFIKDGVSRVKIYKEGVNKGQCWLTLLSTINNGIDEKWRVEVVFRLVPSK